MPFKTDAGGLAFSACDVKLQTGASTWATRLSQLARQEGPVRILTYSLPDMCYIRNLLAKRPHDIAIIAHSKFKARARQIRREFPGVKVAVNDKTHSKVLLVSPKTVIVSSANFGVSGWHETTVSIHDKRVHDWYVSEVFLSLWRRSEEISVESVMVL